jgi:tetratricopeptide (TPR) repeat protein
VTTSTMQKSYVQLSLLVAGVLLVYTASLQNAWVWLDDVNYLLRNDLVSDFTLRRIPELFTSIRGNFTPLTWLTHVAGYRLSGEDAFAHHLLSLLFHLLNVLLVYSLVRGLTAVGLARAPAGSTGTYLQYLPFLATLLFALHPQNVEAVAWIAARKDLVMCTGALLATNCWLSYCRRPTAARFIVSMSLFALAVLAKPTGVMLVVPLFCMTCWVDDGTDMGRRLRRAFFRTLPFILLGMSIAWLAWIAQVSAGAVSAESQFTGFDRAAIVLKNIWGYFARYFLLGDYYLNYPLMKGFTWRAASGALLLAAVTTALCIPRLRAGASLWAITIALLLPGLGIVQYGVQAAADRFGYLAFIPLNIWTAWAIVFALDRLRDPLLRRVALGMLLAVLLLIAGRSFVQSTVWRNDLSLWAHAVTVAPQNALAWQYLGFAFMRHGDYPRALESFEQSLQQVGTGVYMDVRSLYFGIAVASYETGQPEAATDWFKRLLAEDLRGFDRTGYAFYYLARIAADGGQSAGALSYLDKSSELLPNYGPALELRAELVGGPAD